MKPSDSTENALRATLRDVFPHSTVKPLQPKHRHPERPAEFAVIVVEPGDELTDEIRAWLSHPHGPVVVTREWPGREWPHRPRIAVAPNPNSSPDVQPPARQEVPEMTTAATTTAQDLRGENAGWAASDNGPYVEWSGDQLEVSDDAGNTVSFDMPREDLAELHRRLTVWLALNPE